MKLKPEDYGPRDLIWTKPNKKFEPGPGKATEYFSIQARIINEAREQLWQALKLENAISLEELEASEIKLDPMRSMSTEDVYTPAFQLITPTKIRYFKVGMRRSAVYDVDTKDPVAICDVTEEIKGEIN